MRFNIDISGETLKRLEQRAKTNGRSRKIETEFIITDKVNARADNEQTEPDN